MIERIRIRFVVNEYHPFRRFRCIIFRAHLMFVLQMFFCFCYMFFLITTNTRRLSILFYLYQLISLDERTASVTVEGIVNLKGVGYTSVLHRAFSFTFRFSRDREHLIHDQHTTSDAETTSRTCIDDVHYQVCRQ